MNLSRCCGATSDRLALRANRIEYPAHLMKSLTTFQSSWFFMPLTISINTMRGWRMWANPQPCKVSLPSIFARPCCRDARLHGGQGGDITIKSKAMFENKCFQSCAIMSPTTNKWSGRGSVPHAYESGPTRCWKPCDLMNVSAQTSS